MKEGVADTYFYAKVLLFGEYSLMAGSGALTMPYAGAKARLRFPDSRSGIADERASHSNALLARFAGFLAQQAETETTALYASDPSSQPFRFGDLLRLDAFMKDLDAGMYFDSDIPAGYGLGSSGALVAAVYDAYARKTHTKELGNPDVLHYLKSLFASMESFFHGKSSGIDPLSCFLGKPLVFYADGPVKPAMLQPGTAAPAGGFFLIDTGTIRKTEPLVTLFLEKMEQPWFRTFVETEYVALVDQCIAALMLNNMEELNSLIHRLSGLQLIHFAEMIPPGFVSLWEAGYSSGLYALKLCGAGGGGYLLGYTMGFEQTAAQIQQMKPGIDVFQLIS